MEGATNSPLPVPPAEEQSSQNPAPIPVPAERPSNLAQLATANFIRPRSNLIRTNHQVQFARERHGYENFLEQLWDYLDGMLEATGAISSGDLISQDDFVRMGKTLLIYRVQQVREQRMFTRPAQNRIVLARGFLVPAALHEIIAGIGETYIDSRGIFYMPILPSTPDPTPDYYTLDAGIAQQWNRFVLALARNQLHRTVPLTTEMSGTVYWLLDHTGTSTTTTTIQSVFGEGTPSDGLLAALCNISVDVGGQRGFTYVDGISVTTLRQAYFANN